MSVQRLLRRTLRTPVLRGSELLFAGAGLYQAEVNSPIGFFAQLSGLITILRTCERKGLAPAVTLTGSLYADPERGRDFLSYFFDGPAYSAPQLSLLEVLPRRRESDFSLLPGWSRYDYPTLADSARLLGRYYRLKSDVAGEARSFARECLAPGRTLGVHYRGTDKLRTESSAVGYDEVAYRIRRCLAAYPHLTHVYVATDEQEFLRFVTGEFAALRVIAPPDRVRAAPGEAVHTSDGNGYLKGRDALVNCLLLAECAVLLKTMSNLSGWSRVFRPGLPTFLLNRPDKAGLETLGFPEREMVESGWFVDDLSATCGRVDAGRPATQDDAEVQAGVALSAESPRRPSRSLGH
jgi:hypothetical protein